MGESDPLHPMDRMDRPAARLGDRSLFPDLAPFAYLNHAAISAPSAPVRAAALACIDAFARDGVGAVGEAIAQHGRLRAKLAALIGAAPSDIGFVAGTTAGTIDLALCIPWKAGDRILVYDGEFPSNVTPWQRAAELFDLEVCILPGEDLMLPGGADLGRLEAELRRGARLVAASAVQFQTGLRMPLAAIGDLCRAHGAELFVDAIQMIGGLPFDVEAERVDYLASGAQKWLMGLEGVGYVYARPELAAALRPRVAGWLSHEDALGFLFGGKGLLRYDRPVRKRMDFVEGGSQARVAMAALEASLDLITGLGVPAIADHIRRYLAPLEEGLLARGFTSYRARDEARRSGILAVDPPEGTDPVALVASLRQKGVSCSTPDGLIRFAPHWPNALDEVPRVLDAIGV